MRSPKNPERASLPVGLRVPDEVISFTDLHYGPYRENLKEDCGDFVIRRADGVFAYQLAASVDDGLMGVTEVVRGNDLLSSSPRQIWLLRELGFTSPVYGHIPLLTAPDGRRLSKRDGDLDLGAIRARFRGPEPVLGMLAYLCRLIDRPESVTAKELISCFSWDKIPKEDLALPTAFLTKLNG